MNYECPDCQAELTPSIMGHLCHGCGALHSFEKISSVKPRSASATKKIKSTGTKSPVKVSSQLTRQPSENLNAAKPTGEIPNPKPKKTKIRHKVKKFVVPEITLLPKPVDESHLINSSSTKDITKSTSPQMTNKSSTDLETVPKKNNTSGRAENIDQSESKNTKNTTDVAARQDSAVAVSAAGSFDEYMSLLGEIDEKPSSSNVHQNISYAPVRKNYLPIAAGILVTIAGLALVVALVYSS